MATARFICNGALRKLGRLGAGREPRLADSTDTLNALRGLYRSLIAAGTFGRLRDVVPEADYTARENERIFRTSADTLEITLPELVPNWDCLWPYTYGALWVPPGQNQNLSVRPPRNGAVVVIVDSFTTESMTWIYDGSIRQWQSIDDLNLDDEAPLSGSDPEGLGARLALEIADQFGVEPTAATVGMARRFNTSIAHNYSFPRREAAGVFV